MRLTVLGAGTCVPLEGYSPAGYLLRRGASSIVVDAGPGTLPRLQRAGVSYRELHLLLLTHLHPDHTLDLVTLLQANNATPGWRRTDPLRVIGPRGTRRFIERLYQAFEGISPEAYELRVDELLESQHDVDGWHLESARTGHTESSLAYRLEAEDSSIAFSGDAAEVKSIGRVARGADLLVCECSFPEGAGTSDHLTPRQAGEAARQGGVKRLLLSHLYPLTLQHDLVREAGAVFEGTVEVAQDGYSTDV